MGKGKPSPRETAKEKKTQPQKAVSTKASAKKAATAGPDSKKPSKPKGKNPVTAKVEAESVIQRARSAETRKATEPVVLASPAAATAEALRSRPAEPVSTLKPLAHEPPVQDPSVQKPSVQEPLVQEPLAAGSGVQPDERDGVGLPTAGGKVGVFGGPKDRSVKPDDKLALPTGRHYQFEQFRSLNPKGYYCAMRWEYRQGHMSTEEGKRWWANKRLLVTNPANKKSVVVRAVDYGPHETTGLAIAISPGAAEAIGVEPGQEVVVAFADEKAQLGPAATPPGN
jgi:hypothetical protein